MHLSSGRISDSLVGLEKQHIPVAEQVCNVYSDQYNY